MRILILEDDLETLTKLLDHLTHLEDNLQTNIAVTVFSEYWQVEEHLNQGTKEKFDFVLLDRDCKLGGSFHVLDLKKFPASTIIGISSNPEYNKELLAKGVKITVNKDYQHLDNFAEEVIRIFRKNMNQASR